MKIAVHTTCMSQTVEEICKHKNNQLISTIYYKQIHWFLNHANQIKHDIVCSRDF